MSDKPKLCSHYTPEKNGACKYYSPINKPKMGLCKFPMKVTWFCHYSESVAGTYKEDAEIAKVNEL